MSAQYGAKTPIDYAAGNLDKPLVELLHTKGARLTFSAAVVLGRADVVRDELRINPRRYRSYIESSSEQAEMFSSGMLMDLPPLAAAAKLGHEPLVELLLAQSAIGLARWPAVETNCTYGRDCNGKEAALCEAAAAGHVGIMEQLVADGVYINGCSRLGWTALHHAASWNRLAAAEFLLGQYAWLNAPDDRGDTPLHIAASNGRVEMVRRLLLRFPKTWLRNKKP